MDYLNDDRWQSYRERHEHWLIGMMSGTSLDGIDAALVKITSNEEKQIEEVALVEFNYLPYSDELRRRLNDLCSPETARLDQLVEAHYGVAEWYAYSVHQLLEKANFKPEQIDAICCHGQTIWHAPVDQAFPGPEGPLPVRSTLQIGEMSVLTERTGIPVIGNFRARDMAAGGEGAPMVPFADRILFGEASKGRIMQNIGGIGNCTFIPAGSPTDGIFAFDTGPGNMIMDDLVMMHTQGAERYDRGGEIASQGKVDEAMLQQSLSDPYYGRRPPKSTGREVYGTFFTEKFLEEGKKRGLNFEDILATATALTAHTITNAYKDFILPHHEVGEVIVSGGGAHNRTLMKMIREQLPESISLKTAAHYGVPDDAKEAMAFAILGHETMMGRPSNVPSVTGARRAVRLGQVCW
ncbi:anhydro-N-acetylmuramic acid kinase [Ammoniphilus sp. YIM 78166]|uniref:anhydro-N-acetylmuramic acid kinase n=1 Tax=Ammoniphilus sp. YIM 78166 TaxID=1644106 RepID=UPI00107036F4|nr:anhydro-N-acetylmuramic acid kinase [Ammoniphilus sp. YIM 78166]